MSHLCFGHLHSIIFAARMFRTIFLFLFLPLVFGCRYQAKETIVVPRLNSAFYTEVLEQINDELDANPKNDDLVIQKLYYCEQLGWPMDCISALEAWRTKYGMDNQLVEQYMAYYQQHDMHDDLLRLIEVWNNDYGLEDRFAKPYIISLVKSRRKAEANKALKKYAELYRTDDDISFLSAQYLALENRLFAAFYLSKLHKRRPVNELTDEYGRLLVQLGYIELGSKYLQTYASAYATDRDWNVSVASLLDSRNAFQQSRSFLMPYIEEDTLVYFVSRSFQMELLWDSAVWYLNTAIAKDSTDGMPWYKKGRLYEDRGWISYSLPFFERAIELNPNDTAAWKRKNLIERKIAYLQRRKMEQNVLPVLEIQSKKIEN